MSTTSLILILMWISFLIGIPFIIDGIKIDRFKIVWTLLWILTGTTIIIYVQNLTL